MVCRVTKWIESLDSLAPLTPPPDDNLKLYVLAKRKRAAASPPMDVPRSNSQSPAKRPRVDESGDIPSEHNISQFERRSSIGLDKMNTFSLPLSSGTKRSASPSRETPVLLRNASPPVWVNSPHGLRQAPPKHVEALKDRLAQGIDTAVIPHSLQNTIENDKEVGFQGLRSSDFNSGDTHSADELVHVWKRVKKIFLNAHECKVYSKDENAWCKDVVQPIMKLAMDLYGSRKWSFESVQSQSISPEYLSQVIHARRRDVVNRKSDYVLAYSRQDLSILAIYRALEQVGNSEVGHTSDTFTMRTALYSGFEVKAAFGVPYEAELQMSVWIAASLRKKQELAQATNEEALIKTSLVEPAFTIIGHQHHVYYAFPQTDPMSGKEGVQILGPDLTTFEGLNTASIRGIFRLIRLYQNLMESGADDGPNGFWGQFLRPVLRKLAGDEDRA